MAQIHILHANTTAEFAERIVQGLERIEGYSATWDGQHGAMAAMSGKTLDRASQSVCVPIWTPNITFAKWTREAAEGAYLRGMLVELRLDPIESPIDGNKPEPLDFSGWDGEYSGELWKSFVARVRETAGRPTGSLPLKEEAPPALVMVVLAFGVMGGISAGGLPSGVPVQSDSMAALSHTSTLAATAPRTAIGGPVAGVREPASAIPVHYPNSAPHFERMEPAPIIKIVPHKDFSVAGTTELADAEHADNTAPARRPTL
jgi:hypothetical protein